MEARRDRKVRARWSARQWVRLRQVVQVLTLAAFLILFVWSRRGGWPADLVNLPMRLDPLVMLAHLLSSRTVLAGSAVALIVVALSLVLGRAWCGWLCPLGTVLDGVPIPGGRSRRASISDAWRGAKYVLLVTILSAAALTNLSLLVFDPLTILFRTLSTALWPAVDRVVTAAETTLYSVPQLRGMVSAFDGVVRPTVLPYQPIFYRYTALYAAAFLAILGLNLVSPRSWCRYLCPLGALLALPSKVGWLQREVNDRCTACDRCAAACPTGTIEPEEGYASDPGECTVCLDCAAVCPVEAIEFSGGFRKPQWNTYDPDRRHVLAATGASLVGIGLLRSSLSAEREHPRLIRPPGARENSLLSKCIRCGECNRACPTSVIQPAVAEAGLEGLWTPVLVPRAGYCDYSCNACGQVCPVQAIPPLTLQVKRQQVIGQAYIDENRCIAWADATDCIVCEEMCPVPEKAIVLDESQAVRGEGERVSVQLPRVIRERCIGCGICEYKCPVNGEAAIRVYVPSQDGSAVPF